MKFLKYLIAVLSLYVFFHNPLFTFMGGIGSIKILDIISIFILFISWNTIQRYLIVFKKEIVVFLLIILYTIFRSLIGGDSNYIRSTLVAIIEIFVVPISVICIINNYFSIPEKGFIRAILITGSVGAVISTICITQPSFGLFVKYQLQMLGDTLEEMEYRGFGISEALTSSYSYIQGLIIVFGTIYLNENKWFILAYPFIFISVILNARTGIILIIIGLLVYFITSRKLKSFISVGVLMIVLFLSFNQIINKTNFIDENYFQLAETLVDEVSDMESERNLRGSATMDALLGQMIVFPDTFEEWIIGRGYSIFGTGKNITSDVGFILQLNYGGIIYLSLLFFLIVIIIKRMRFYHIDNWFVLLFFVTFLICNFKGEMLPNTGIFRFLMILYIYKVLCKKQVLSEIE